MITCIIKISAVLCQDRRAYVRDAACYLIACGMSLHLLSRGALSAGDAGVLLGVYAVYLFVCIYSSR